MEALSMDEASYRFVDHLPFSATRLPPVAV